MAEKVLDRRVQKTRKLLQDAMIELVSEKGYQRVTIREILDRANVGRSTFYTHFQDKHELLQSCLETLGKLLEQHIAEVLRVRNFGYVGSTDFILSVLRLVERNRSLFKALLGKQGIAMFYNPIYDYLFDYFYEGARMVLPRKGVSYQPEMMTHYFVSALIGILRWWVEKDMPCPAEEVDLMFRQLTMKGLHDKLNKG